MSLSQERIENALLAGLSPEDFALFEPHLRRVTLGQRHIVYEIEDVIESVYFIEAGVSSVVIILAQGASVEVGMVGFEGLTGFPVLLGDKVSRHHVVQQLPGEAFQMSATKCKELFEGRESIRAVFLPFVNAFLVSSAQTAACNRFHSLEQRLARWLLMSGDRFRAEMLPLTQEYIATMLGVRRSGVSEIAGELQRRGLIRYHHGEVTILDHRGLEGMACECSAIDRDRFLRSTRTRN